MAHQYPASLEDALNKPRPGRKSGADWHKHHVSKDELIAIIHNLMEHNGPSRLTDREYMIVKSLR